jgi:hypothetical protein
MHKKNRPQSGPGSGKREILHTCDGSGARTHFGSGGIELLQQAHVLRWRPDLLDQPRTAQMRTPLTQTEQFKAAGTGGLPLCTSPPNIPGHCRRVQLPTRASALFGNGKPGSKKP